MTGKNFEEKKMNLAGQTETEQPSSGENRQAGGVGVMDGPLQGGL